MATRRYRVTGAEREALACLAPPEERGRWTLRLLASRMVEWWSLAARARRPATVVAAAHGLATLLIFSGVLPDFA